VHEQRPETFPGEIANPQPNGGGKALSIKELLNPKPLSSNMLKTDSGVGVFLDRDDPRNIGIFGYYSLGTGLTGGGLTFRLGEDPVTSI
jgi:hypothetical protein